MKALAAKQRSRVGMGRWFFASALVGMFVLLVGPWPVDRTPLNHTQAYRGAMAVLDSSSLVPHAISDLEGGFASVTLALPEGVPLAGYSARDGAASLGSHDPIRAKAMVLRAGGKTAAIVSADILLVDTDVAQRVREGAAEWVDAEDIYFAATHTHSGPGGWASNWSIGLVTGASVASVATQLVNDMVAAIRDAHASLRSTRVIHGKTRVPEFVENRLRESPDSTVDSWLQLVRFDGDDGRHIGSLVSYSAHATVLGADNLLLSAGYPGVLERELERAWGGSVFFLAGSVGSMRPSVETIGSFGDVSEMGLGLATHAKWLFENGEMTRLDPPLDFVSRQLKLPVPSLHARISQHLRLSPLLLPWLLGVPSHASFQVLGLGSLLLVGSPAELSGEIAVALSQRAETRGTQLVISSFNGSYFGYVLPDAFYRLVAYETGWVNLLGPHGGSFVEAVIRRVVDLWTFRDARSR